MLMFNHTVRVCVARKYCSVPGSREYSRHWAVCYRHHTPSLSLQHLFTHTQTMSSNIGYITHLNVHNMMWSYSITVTVYALKCIHINSRKNDWIDVHSMCVFDIVAQARQHLARIQETISTEPSVCTLKHTGLPCSGMCIVVVVTVEKQGTPILWFVLVPYCMWLNITIKCSKVFLFGFWSTYMRASISTNKVTVITLLTWW